ncbi:unnamed protein product [Moneuplotes crassus]|uniref:EamA domain-containing protein n=1 Tax=Euplotes crassus TaxID=5936 RepID=A0AAD2CZ26_EUPCR|nr:unnamed protein product [Moneuplotes crassus]
MNSLKEFDGIEESKESSLIQQRKENSDQEVSQLSKSISIVKSISLNPHKNLPEQNALIGYSLMVVALFGLTMRHLFAKMAFFYNENITPFDLLLAIGVVNVPIFLILNIIVGTEINLCKYECKVRLTVFISCLASICVMTLMMSGMAMISIAKTTLIFDLNPLFCIIMAFIILRERIDYPSVGFTFGAITGIYLLALNKSSATDDEESSAFLGIFLVFLSSSIQGTIMVLLRMLAIYNVHFLVRPLYSSVGICIFCGLVYFLIPGKIHFPDYSALDLLLLFMNALGYTICLPALAMALMYQKSSHLAPVNYLENVFALLADFFIFKYTFVWTDYLGMGIIFVCLLIPAILKIKNES